MGQSSATLVKRGSKRSHIGRVEIVALALTLAFGSSPASAGTVAITIDDLPIFGDLDSLPRAEATTAHLLAGFGRHHWQVAGFVIGSQLEAPHRTRKMRLLSRWLDAGMELGNHSYSHYSLTATPVGAYLADVAKGDRVIGALLARRGQRVRWFRHPYLETGSTLAIRARVDHWLLDHGYRIAPVSMENADWEFAEPYDEALAHGRRARAATIRRAYLAYTSAMIAWYRAAAAGVLGREPAFVLLLHASRLNAGSIDAIAALLAHARLRPVTLEQAMADPAYRIPDGYAGPNGYSWVQRWAIALHRPWRFDLAPRVPADIAARYAAIEAADPDVKAPPRPRTKPR